MYGEPSVVGKMKAAIDDVLDLWRQNLALALIIVLFLVIPMGLSGYQEFVVEPRLTAQISEKQQKITTLQHSLQKAEQERDQMKIQLRTFLAAAERTFPNVPPDERLDLLAKYEAAISRLQAITGNNSPDRILSPELKNTLVANLKALPPLGVELTCPLGDAEGFALASQIKGVFEAASWKVNDVSQAPAATTIKQSYLVTGKPLPPELLRALTPLLESLGAGQTANVDDKIGEGNLQIMVGSK